MRKDLMAVIEIRIKSSPHHRFFGGADAEILSPSRFLALKISFNFFLEGFRNRSWWNCSL